MQIQELSVKILSNSGLAAIRETIKNFGPLAQLVEQIPLKDEVGGSSPPWPIFVFFLKYRIYTIWERKDLKFLNILLTSA